ncbi:heparinase II/III domain-containing protein [Gemmatimonas sp.]|uniref:heparinase II/III domain-containing protein n=1 Tax=Gemmatimonas sp. TaxID=1962908 RepID=UPI003DA4D19F
MATPKAAIDAWPRCCLDSTTAVPHEGDTGRARSTADAERNTPAVALSRADCSWRALLMAGAQPVPAESWQPQSLVQPRQGLAIIRRDSSRVYVALEGGVSGGGHGHPDRLSLTLQTGRQRWLDDPGTGSYVERTLHWYPEHPRASCTTGERGVSIDWRS